MPKIYKVKEHDPKSDGFIYSQTSADIVDFDSSKSENLTGDSVQTAMESMNVKVEDRVTKDALIKTVDKINESIMKVDKKADDNASTITFKTTIVSSSFEGTEAPFTQKIFIDGIKASDNPIVGVLVSDSYRTALDEKEEWGNISRITCDDGFITVYCFENKPSVDLNIQIKVIR